MASENAQTRRSKRAESTSENTRDGSGARRGRAPVVLPDRFADVLAGYVAALASAPLSEQSRRTYASKVRQYLVWLAGAEVDGDPLGAAAGRDWAVRDYRGYLQSVLKRSPATINNALAAVDDFYSRRGLGPARAKRAEVPAAAPRALAPRRRSGISARCKRASRRVIGRSRWCRSMPARGSPRRSPLTSTTCGSRRERACCAYWEG